VGIALGGLAGAGAAHSLESWESLQDTAGVVSPRQSVSLEAAAARPFDSDEISHQISHLLITRALALIARGEIREAERFVAAAEKLSPESPILEETRRLLDIAKARIELAGQAPASGRQRAEPTEYRAMPLAEAERQSERHRPASAHPAPEADLAQ
jgi:hypothetical protein